MPEPALCWKREEAERIVKPAALSDLPVFTAEPEPSSSSAARPPPPRSPRGLLRVSWGLTQGRLRGTPSQDLLGGSFFFFPNAVGLGWHPSPRGILAGTDTRARTVCSPAGETSC